MNPGLLYTPRGAGGIGLISIDVAVCTQNLKHAMQWLVRKPDRYLQPWLAWTFQHPSASETWSLSPAFLPRRCSPESQGPQPNISTEICSWLAPGREEWEKVKRNQRNSIQRMQEHLVATRTDRTLLLQCHDEIPIHADTFTQEHTTFWATYRWDLNPWILDEKGRTLSTSLYPLLKA